MVERNERRARRKEKARKKYIEHSANSETIIYPTTPKGWYRRMNDHGQSHRKPPRISDLQDVKHSRDPEGFKSERVALAGIMSLRAYQIAKPEWIEAVQSINIPPSDEIQTFSELKMKNRVIGAIFIHEMMTAVKIDEDTETKPTKATEAYTRLDTILTPLKRFQKTPNIYLRTVVGEIKYPRATPVMQELWMGMRALPGDLDLLMEYTLQEYPKQHDGALPSKQSLFAIMRNSYKTFSKPMAELHMIESLPIVALEMKRAEQDPSFQIASLNGNHLELSEQARKIIDEYRTASRETRSVTTRCAFLIDPKEVEQFLDQPADFDDALKDAFDTHMDLLAA